MRPDMSKIIVERPRARGKYSRCNRVLTGDLENLPHKESIRQRWNQNWDRKELNENLSPLRRFLEAQVGRPWDKVYSEVRKTINLNSAVQYHVYQHVFDFVLLDIEKRDGEVYWKNYPSCPLSGSQLYVDPDTGLLCRTPPSKKIKQEKTYVRWKHNDPSTMVQYHKIDDIWYEVGLASIPTTMIMPLGLYDVVHRKSVHDWRSYMTVYGGPYYAVYKFQMNSREIKRLRLND